MGVTVRPLACLSLLLLAPVACDEMAFVSVTASDQMTVTFLDVRVKTKAGIAGLFEGDPMISHDWVATNVVNRTVGAIIRAADGSTLAREVKAVEEQLAPLYATMVKNEHSRLDREAVRYVLHRHFDGSRGWSIKGLEPAGNAWVKTMAVTPDVRQLTKYIVPGYIMENLVWLSGGQGLDLRWLSIFAVSLDRLIHAEMTEYLYDVFTTLELPISGLRSNEELERIAMIFAMVFTLGTNLEVSTKRAMERLDEFLGQQHGAWHQLMAFVRDLLARERPAVADFAGVLRFVERMATEYAGWQSRDCKLASDVLQGTAGFDRGRVPLDAVSPRIEPGHRALFTESADHMRSLGVVDGEQLVMANYLLSQDMCLSTSSFYAVCCPDACNKKLGLLERSLMSHAAGAGAIADALGATSAQRASLEAVAAPLGGRVELHGPALSRWLHESFPAECPAPSEKYEMNPRTADEWMRVPKDDATETEELISDLKVGVSNFAKLGLKAEAWQESREDVELPQSPLETILGGGEDPLDALAPATSWKTWLYTAGRLCIALVLLGSMGSALRAVLSDAVGGAQGRGPKGKGPSIRREADDGCAA